MSEVVGTSTSGTKPDPLTVLSEFSLEEIREQLAKLEEERDQVIGEYEGKIAALKTIEKAVNLRVNGKPKRAPRTTSSKPAPKRDISDLTREEQKVADFLLKNNSQPVREICGNTGLHHKTVGKILERAELFVRELDGTYRLTRPARDMLES